MSSLVAGLAFGVGADAACVQERVSWGRSRAIEPHQKVHKEWNNRHIEIYYDYYRKAEAGHTLGLNSYGVRGLGTVVH